MEANGDVGAAADAGHELEAKLEASGDVEVAAQVGHVAAVMDEMLAAEVAVEDLDVAVTEAEAVAVKLRVEGKEEEAKACAPAADDAKAAEPAAAASGDDYAEKIAKINGIKESHPNNLAMKHFDIAYFNGLSDEEKKGWFCC